ncbi:MAG: autotransporter-associated beta strand repeat-containing protein, partial [Planctomycetota bacterium]
MLSILRSAALGAVAAILLAAALQVASAPAATFSDPTSYLSGTAPSGLAWSAVATGTALPIRTSGSLNGSAGAVAYFDTNTGQIQFDPKGLNISTFILTYTTGTVNISATTPGPFQYTTGTGQSAYSPVTGTPRTFPAKNPSSSGLDPTTYASRVNLTVGAPLSASLNSGSNPNSASSGTSGFWNQAWAFPSDLVISGSVATMALCFTGTGNNYFRTTITGTAGSNHANVNILGYGSQQGVFQYNVSGATGNQLGPVIPYSSAVTPRALIWNTTSGTWNTSATNWTTGTAGTFAFSSGDSVTFSGTGGGSVTLSGSLAPSSVTVSATAGSYTLSSSAGNQITGTAALSKSGAGTLVLAGPNAYSGGTTLSAGTLRVGDNAAVGTGTLALNGGTLTSDGATARTVTNAVTVGGDVGLGDATATGALTLSGNVDLGGVTRTLTTVADTTLSGVISGSGGLTKAGACTLTLTGSNTYSGDTTVSAGRLSIGAGSTTGSVTGNIVNNADLTFHRSDAVTYAGVISGSGAVLKDGAGTLTLTGSNTYSGGTTVSAGRLAIGAGGTTGSVTGNIVNNADLTFARSDAVTYAGVISGSGGLTKDGAGVLTLTSNSTFTGRTDITAGTLKLSGAGGIGWSAIIAVEAGATLDVSAVTGGWQLASGQTLTGDGTVVGPATAAVGSTVNPGGVSGTLTATGGFTLLGLLD